MNSSTFTAQQQKMINECKEMGLDCSGFAKPHIDAFKMQLAFKALRKGKNLTPYLEKFNHEQLDQILIGLINNTDVSQYAIVELSGDEMMHNREVLEFKTRK